MSNASLGPSKLENHLDKKHPLRKNDDIDEGNDDDIDEGNDDDIDALSTKKVPYDLEATLPHLGFTLEEKPTLQCSYEVAYRIAKCKKPHIIAEELIKPCAEKKVKIMIESEAKKKIQQISLSDDTIRRRIDDMAANV